MKYIPIWILKGISSLLLILAFLITVLVTLIMWDLTYARRMFEETPPPGGDLMVYLWKNEKNK